MVPRLPCKAGTPFTRIPFPGWLQVRVDQEKELAQGLEGEHERKPVTFGRSRWSDTMTQRRICPWRAPAGPLCLPSHIPNGSRCSPTQPQAPCQAHSSSFHRLHKLPFLGPTLTTTHAQLLLRLFCGLHGAENSCSRAPG